MLFGAIPKTLSPIAPHPCPCAQLMQPQTLFWGWGRGGGGPCLLSCKEICSCSQLPLCE